MIIEKEDRKKRMKRFISNSQLEAVWSRQRKGDSKSGMEEQYRGKLLSSLTLKKISQMRKGMHANVKDTMITGCQVLQGEG